MATSLAILWGRYTEIALNSQYLPYLFLPNFNNKDFPTTFAGTHISNEHF
jgi:hypothetical protein